jgi:hypothetical protein
MWHLCGVFTLAINISLNNDPIDLLLIEEMILHKMVIHVALSIISAAPLLMKLQYL